MASQLANRLREAGYKLTPARQAVLQVLETAEEYLNHADVLARGQAIYPALGRATVYRTLELLTNLGIVRPIYLSEGGTHFTRADCAHHHLLCSDCGVVIEFDDCVIAELEQTLSQRLDFRIKGHLLEFYGLCSYCYKEE